MKKFVSLLAIALPFLLSACSNDDFQGRYTDNEGVTSYQFEPDGKVEIVTANGSTTAHYNYDASAQTITLKADQTLPVEQLDVNDDGSLQADKKSLQRAADESMLADSTWIGDQGPYTFALTFKPSDKGLETYSELVTYYDDDMTYLYQTDDSITRLQGNKLLLDKTVYTVSEVTDNSLKLTIAGKSMVIHKQPPGTAVEFRDGYHNIDDEE
jgi:hypothetical protein